MCCMTSSAPFAHAQEISGHNAIERVRFLGGRGLTGLRSHWYKWALLNVSFVSGVFAFKPDAKTTTEPLTVHQRADLISFTQSSFFCKQKSWIELT